MLMSPASAYYRNTIVTIGGSVTFLFLLFGVFEIKPTYTAGFFTPTPPELDVGTSTITEPRRRELETILSSPPKLSWSVSTRNRAILESGEGIFPDEDGAIKVSPDYFEHFPDLTPYSVEQRKKYFVSIMLPLILRANVELVERRQLILKAVEDGNVEQLRKWVELYRWDTDTTDIQELQHGLLRRVDQVPVSIALAQAAIESGWGTSRFAIQGNAGFGQWAWSNNQGIKPIKASNNEIVVRSFPNIYESVRAYMHNLNTFEPYENFRIMRQRGTDIETLANTLLPYSVEREVYVDKIRSMIDVNNFTIYDSAVLLPE